MEPQTGSYHVWLSDTLNLFLTIAVPDRKEGVVICQRRVEGWGCLQRFVSAKQQKKCQMKTCQMREIHLPLFACRRKEDFVWCDCRLMWKLADDDDDGTLEPWFGHRLLGLDNLLVVGRNRNAARLTQHPTTVDVGS